MTDSVGIKAWITNSQIVHAVADAPRSAPWRFSRKEVVMPVFAHEPTVSRAPSGEWVMYFTSNFGEKRGSQCNPPCLRGHNGTSALQVPNPFILYCACVGVGKLWPLLPVKPDIHGRLALSFYCQCPNDQQCHAEPRSPLSTFMSYSNSTSGPWSTPALVPSDHQGGDTNLACVIRRNASLVCLGRPNLGMLRADDWRDVSQYAWSKPSQCHFVVFGGAFC